MLTGGSGRGLRLRGQPLRQLVGGVVGGLAQGGHAARGVLRGRGRPRRDAQGDAWRVAGKADVPLVTDTVRALDGLVEGSAPPRSARDPAMRTLTPAAELSRGVD